MVIFVRSEGGYALTGYNDQGEAIFERTAWSVGLPAVKAEVVALAAKGIPARRRVDGGREVEDRPDYTRGPLRRRFSAEY